QPPPQPLGFRGESPALVIVKPHAAPTDLFPKNSILLHQVLNDSLLLPLHPASDSWLHRITALDDSSRLSFWTIRGPIFSRPSYWLVAIAAFSLSSAREPSSIQSRDPRGAVDFESEHRGSRTTARGLYRWRDAAGVPSLSPIET